MTASTRVLNEWRNRVSAEYRSAALTAQTVHWMIQAGLPDPVLHLGLRIVGDELDHAKLSHDCLLALGGADEPAAVELAALANPIHPDGLLPTLVDSIVRNFCLGETFAVPLFNAMRTHTTHPAALPALTRILADEAIHRAFGWEVLDRLLEIDADGLRAHVEPRLASWLSGFETSYASGSGSPLTAEERAAGLLDLDDYAAVFWDTVRGDIAKRFASRGIALPVRYV